MDELIKSLRSIGERNSPDGRGIPICDEAADAIERIKACNKQGDRLVIELQARIAQLEADLAFQKQVTDAARRNQADLLERAENAEERIAQLFDVLMRQNIEVSSEAYLILRVVGVPPSEDEFVRSITRAIDAAIEHAEKEKKNG